MMRAATAIGALLEEADAAHSRADFLSKMTTSLKEARETRYWLRILHVECKPERKSIDALGAEVTEVIAVLTTIIKNTRKQPA